LKRSITEVKWREAKVTGEKYQYSRLREPRQKPDSGPENTNKRLAARFYQLKTDWPIPHVGGEAAHR
jgi:hypothetical protein